MRKTVAFIELYVFSMPDEPAIEAINPQKGAIKVTAGSTNTQGSPKVHRLVMGWKTWL